MRWFVALLVASLVLVGIWPVRYLASPRWEVWVVAENGEPLSGMSVRLVYENYSAEKQGHELTLLTDAAGHALFPPQYQRACLFRGIFYTALEARAGVHASFGRHA